MHPIYIYVQYEPNIAQYLWFSVVVRLTLNSQVGVWKALIRFKVKPLEDEIKRGNKKRQDEEGREAGLGREDGKKCARRFLWDSGMLLLFLCRRRRGDKCVIEAMGCGGAVWWWVKAQNSLPEQGNEREYTTSIFTAYLPWTSLWQEHVDTVTALI